MTDFGLGDDIVDEEKRLEALRWHGLVTTQGQESRCKMKAGKTILEVGTKIRVLDIADDDPDEAVGVVGSEGEITHPFGDQPQTIAGVWVESRGNHVYGATFPSGRVGLCSGDRVLVLETGEEVTL